MNINYESYKIFYQVALCQSISKAAEKMMLSQPAVTWHIKNLEDHLGTPLFIRTKKGVLLTEQGQVLFQYVKVGIDSFTNGENAITNMKNLDFGLLRIGASTTVSQHVLMPYLKLFHEKFPNIEINIVNDLTENLIHELRNGNLDVLFLNMPMDNAKDLIVKKITTVQDIFVGNKKFYDITQGKIRLEDLEKYPLLFQKNPSNTKRFLESYLKAHHIELIPKMEIVSYNLIMDFVKNGFGIGYATKEFIKKELEDKSLYELAVFPSIPTRFIGLVTLNNKIPNFSVHKLMELIFNS